MAGKRGKSGRKSAGEFSGLTSSLTIRIPDDMRKQLETEAAAGGQSISQVLLWHLRQSFNRQGELSRPSSVRAFCFLFSELVDKIQWASGPHVEWQNDPFLFRTFKIAVTKLLDTFEPEGELQPPLLGRAADTEGIPKRMVRGFKVLASTWRSPRSAANDAVRQVLSDLRRSANEPNGYRKLMAKLANDPDDFVREVARLGVRVHDRTKYGMADVRRDLEPKPKTTKPEGNSID